MDTRLKKIALGAADATVLAAAELGRLGIESWLGLELVPLDLGQMVPAIGQAAIAVQCRADDVALFRPAFDAETNRAVGFERSLQTALGTSCHTAGAAHVLGNELMFFDERTGSRSVRLTALQFERPAASAREILRGFGLI